MIFSAGRSAGAEGSCTPGVSTRDKKMAPRIPTRSSTRIKDIEARRKQDEAAARLTEGILPKKAKAIKKDVTKKVKKTAAKVTKTKPAASRTKPAANKVTKKKPASKKANAKAIASKKTAAKKVPAKKIDALQERAKR